MYVSVFLYTSKPEFQQEVTQDIGPVSKDTLCCLIY